MMINNVRQIRKSIFQMTQSDFALLAGVTQATVSRWENDEFAAEPSLSDIKAIRDAAIARGLPWDDDYLFAWPGGIARPGDGVGAGEDALREE